MAFLSTTSGSRQFQVVPLEDQPLLVGRAGQPEVSLGLEDITVSRHHARLRPTASGWLLEDLGSTNGTKINDEPVSQPVLLHDGDQLLFGKVPYRYTIEPPVITVAVEEPPATQIALGRQEFAELDSAQRRLAFLYEIMRLVDTAVPLPDFDQDLARWMFRNFQPCRLLLRLDEDTSLGFSPDEAETRRQRLAQQIEDPLRPLGLRPWSQSSPEDDHYVALYAPIPLEDSSPGMTYLERPHQEKPFTREDLYFLTAIGRLAGTALQNRRRAELAADRISHLEDQIANQILEGLVGESPAMRDIQQKILKFGPHPIPVCIIGQSGSGKSVTAQAIHRASGRKGRFVEIPCRELMLQPSPQDLLDRAQTAQGGTLVLDEIGMLPRPLQPVLLDLLTADSSSELPDIRLLVTSRIPLRDLVSDQTLREDLFYALRKLVLELPPLPSRMEDLPLLCHYLIQLHAPPGSLASVQPQKVLTPQALDLLYRHPWRGNLRELEGVIQMCVLDLKEGKHINAELISRWMDSSSDEPSPASDLQEEMNLAERNFIIRARQESKGNLTRTASLLGWSRPTLYKKLREHAIER